MFKGNFFSAGILALSLMTAVGVQAEYASGLRYDHIGLAFGTGDSSLPGLDSDLVNLDLRWMFGDTVIVSAQYTARSYEFSQFAQNDSVVIAAGMVFPMEFAVPTDLYANIGVHYTELKIDDNTGLVGKVDFDDQGVIMELGFKVAPCEWIEIGPFIAYSRFNELESRVDMFGVKAGVPLAENVDFTMKVTRQDGDDSSVDDVLVGIEYRY